jgi:hypothetical protein
MVSVVGFSWAFFTTETRIKDRKLGQYSILALDVFVAHPSFF